MNLRLKNPAESYCCIRPRMAAPALNFAAGRDGLADTATDGGLVFLGNFDVNIEHQQRIGHLFGPLRPEMQAE